MDMCVKINGECVESTNGEDTVHACFDAVSAA